MADGWGRENEVAFWYDEGLVLGWRGESWGHGKVTHDFANDAVDGRMYPERLTDDSVEDGKCFQRLVRERSELALLASPEMLDLFSVECFAAEGRQHWENSQISRITHVTSGLSARRKKAHEVVAELVCWPAIKRAIMM